MTDLIAVIDASTRWAPLTRMAYRQAVMSFLSEMGGAMTGVAAETWRDGLLARGLSAVTVRKMMAALKAVSKRAERLGVGSDFAAGAELPRLPAWQPAKPPKSSSIARLMETCQRDRTPRGRRDLSMILLAAQADGERRSEVVGHKIGDLRGGVLEVRRKGGTVQSVVLDDDTLEALREWLEWRGGTAVEPMFIALVRTVEDTWEKRRPLTGAAFAGILDVRCKEAAIDPIRPHDLRRFFISALLDSGEKPHKVMLACGHKSLNTTSRYIGPVDEKAAPAGNLIAALLRRK